MDKKYEQCEWCEKPANQKFSVSPKYVRFSCETHSKKTAKLVQLDGHDAVTFCISSQPFEAEGHYDIPNHVEVIVTGGRDYGDSVMVNSVLALLKPRAIIQGGSTGADEHARNWAKGYNIQSITHKANWLLYGKAAGPMRNTAMLMAHPNALVVAFPGGKGTKDCVSTALKLKHIVFQILVPSSNG